MDERHVLLAQHLKTLRLPAFLSSYQRVADHCARANRSYLEFLSVLAEEEIIRRAEGAIAQRIRAAKFPSLKTLSDL